MAVAARNSHLAGRASRSLRTAAMACLLPRWILAVSRPIAFISLRSSLRCGNSVSSMREQCGARRRIAQPLLKERQGSAHRTALWAILPQRDGALASPSDQFQAEESIALA